MALLGRELSLPLCVTIFKDMIHISSCNTSVNIPLCPPWWLMEPKSCLSLHLCRIKMINSINFLPMALAKLPDMFDFNELKKEYFPHLFNRMENHSVVSDILPEFSYYNPDFMKPEDRDREVLTLVRGT